MSRIANLSPIALERQRAYNREYARRWREGQKPPQRENSIRLLLRCSCDISKLLVHMDGLDSELSSRERFLEMMDKVCDKHLLIMCREMIQLGVCS